MSEADAYKTKMNTMRQSLLNIRKYAKECLTLSDLNIENVYVRMKRAEELLTQFLDTETKLFMLNGDETSRFGEIEDIYYAAIGDFNETVSKRKLSIGSEGFGFQSFNSAHNIGMTSEIRDTKLPKLDIPKFSGNYTDWQSFYEIFIQQIHECPRLSDIQKFHYLKGYLTDEAANLVKHMHVTAANYSEALDKLRRRYDRKRHTVNSFIRKFIEQPAIHQANSSNIRKLHDICDEVIRGLKSIGTEAENRDPWLVYLILNKLDNDTKCEWAEYSAKDEFPSFVKLLEFLSNRIDALESYGVAVKSICSKSAHNVKSYATTTTTSQCTLCKADCHKLYECTQFKEFSTNDRRNFIADNNRCYNCLNIGHNVYNCRFRGRCQKCYRKHHSLLHEEEHANEENITKSDQPPASSDISNLHCARSDNTCILPTAIVKIQRSSGTFHLCKTLLDSASEVSFISENCFKRLDLPRERNCISIKGLGSTYMGKTKGMVQIKISNDDATYKAAVNAFIVPHIATMHPKSDINKEMFQNFKYLKLADPDCLNGGEVDLLLGSDIFFDILTDGKIQNKQMIAYNTKFGWIQVGKLNIGTGAATAVNLNVMLDVDYTLRKFWEIENIPKSSDAPEKEACEQSFLKTTQIAPDNKFIVRLPFKIEPDQLGSTYNIAFKRLISMERRFQKDSTFKSLYYYFMSEYESLGHMKLIGEPNPNEYFLPHHGVLKHSTTTRLRVVFDGSTKSTSNLSLNDILQIGPTIQSSLVEIITRFRQHRYVLSGDIEKMYRMIWIHEDDMKYQQILWRTNPNAPPQAYQLRTVTYGTTSGSFLSTRCIKEVANRIEYKYPQIANILSQDIYVDDLMCGSSSISGLIDQKNILVSTLKQYGFNLRKLRSNHPNAIIDSNEGTEANSQKEFSDDDDISKLLGLIWNSNQDEFSFKCKLQEFACLTKRGLLSDASKIFDPMGWLSPLVIKIKIIFQRLWLEPITWDDLLPQQIKEDWMKLRKSLSEINKIRIPRWLNTSNNIELCGFCDASELAYSAVIYAISGIGIDRKSTILIAKTKVAPLAQITLARLELQAAHMLTQLMSFVERTLTIEIENITLFTDSKLVLDWLSSLPKRWKTFVANRTSYILSQYKRSYWQHIASEENPADCATRGLNVEELINHNIWWNGPAWIREDKITWPTYSIDHPIDSTIYEERRQVNSYIIVKNNFWEQFLSRYSSFYRMCYNLAIISKCVRHLENKFKTDNSYFTRSEVNILLRPSPEDIKAASYRICLYEQQQHFAEEYNLLSKKQAVSNKSKIKTLSPFIHEDKLIRVGGRLTNSKCNFNMMHPIILSNNSTICKPLIRDYHQFYGHAGAGLCLSLLRRKYWILKCKNVIRLIIHKCIKCFRANPQNETQLMGELPECRVQYTHAFANTGIDYCGPFEGRITNRRGQPTTKFYVCLFVCLATKAVHTEIVSNLSSEGFIAALQRFVSRRGLCENIYSDNGTNFVGANNHLRELYALLKKHNEQIYSYLLRSEIKWHFIPPGAPHMGGIWEASVKLLKSNIRKVTNGHVLSLEEFTTIIIRIEAAINSRPLYIESNDDDMDAITPAHFLIGRSLTEVPEADSIDVAKSHYSRWKMIKQIYQHFWQRWHRDYITTLQRRTKWYKTSKNLQIDDIVLVVDDKTPSCYWPLARVINIHPGRDSLVRVVTVKIPRSNTVLQRPISKICKLPIDQEEEPQQSELNQSDSGRAECSDAIIPD